MSIEFNEPREAPTLVLLPDRHRQLAPFFALCLIALIPLLPAMLAGYFPRTHEEFRYQELTVLFADGIRHGNPYPRWLPSVSGGMGYPTFLFYQPVFFYVAAFCLALPGVTATTATYYAAYLFFLSGAGGIYAATRETVGRATALAIATLFVITPFAFSEMNLRGDMSELCAMMLAPWPLVCLMRAERALQAGVFRTKWFVAAALAVALLVGAHPMFALIDMPMLVLLIIGRWPSMPRAMRRSWLLATVAIFIAAIALSSPYWFVVAQNRPYVHIERALTTSIPPEQELVSFRELVSNAWMFGASQARALGRGVAMSFQLGLPHLIFALAGAWLGRRRPWMVGLAVAYVVLVLTMTPLATPLWAWSKSPLRVLQFPWRLLSVLAVPQVVLAAAAVASIRSPARRTIIAWACVIVAAAWYHQMFVASTVEFRFGPNRDRLATISWADADAMVAQDIFGLAGFNKNYANANEFDPIWFNEKPEPRGTRPMIDLPGAHVRYASDHSSAHIHAFTSLDTPSLVTVQQFYFPGWRVDVNGATVPDTSLRGNVTDDGRLRIALPAGKSEVVAYYDGPQHWVTRTVLALLALVASRGLLLMARQNASTTTAALPLPGTVPDL